MKGERAASEVKTTKAFGDTPPDIPHPSKSDHFRLNPTNSGYKKIKTRPAMFPSAFICVYSSRRSAAKADLWLNSVLLDLVCLSCQVVARRA